MLDLKNIIKNKDEIKRGLENRGFNPEVIEQIVAKAAKRSEVMTKLQQLEAKRNELSKKIGVAKSNGESIEAILQEVSQAKTDIASIKSDSESINVEITEMLMGVPNVPLESVPVGKSEDDNVLINEHIIGELKKEGEAHYDIASNLDIVDFERAVKISGTRFWAYKGAGAKLVRALENYMLNKHIDNGYTELRPPVIVKASALKGTGQLPKFEEDLFKLAGTDSYLIPTAEVPLTNFYSNEIVDLSKPIALTAFTPCFRSEAGSAGRDTRGLIRAHQFNKVELVKITSEEDASKEFDKTLEDAKGILEDLKLSYRELELCTGDIGFSARRTVDLEVWLPSEGKFREISSVSIFGDYQARRAAIRYKTDKGNKYASTINGSGLAIDRTVAAILENYQNADGSITVPQVLVPYMGIEVIK